MIIFIVAMLFYTFTALTFSNSTNMFNLLANSYVLAFGEFNNTEQITMFEYVVFVFFVFFITLVLMNLLIAIMGNTFANVQANIVSADLRILAKMLIEIEEIHAYREKVKDSLVYLFYTIA